MTVSSQQAQSIVMLFVLLLLLALSFRINALALVALPDNGKTSITSKHIQVTQKTIQITVKDQPLREVLQYIQNNFGIRFSLDDSVKDEKLSASIKAKNWKKALHKLLNDHNRTAILGDAGQLQHVFILGQRTGIPPVKNAYFIPSENASKEKSTIDDQGTADAPPGISNSHQPYHPGPPQQSNHNDAGPAKNSSYNTQANLSGPQAIENSSEPTGETPPTLTTTPPINQ